MNAKPFIKWVGGKRQLLPELEKHLPDSWNTYHEPFIGGGALFFHLRNQGRITKAVLSDSNPYLIATYRGIRDDVDSVIRCLDDHHAAHSVDYFMRIRKLPPPIDHIDETAAWFIYLNKMGYNGLWRTNRSGAYNVPPDKDKHPDAMLDPENLHACSLALQGVELNLCDYLDTEARTQPGDLVYLDPPYVPLSATSNFTAYTKDPFGPTQQAALESMASRMVSRGVHVVLSNSSAPPVYDLYHNWNLHEVDARRNVSCKGDGRGSVKELIITGAPQ